jgi:hypothetical protein
VQGNSSLDGDTERWFRLSDPKTWPKCVNNTQSILDFRCENGNWTTRTKKLALTMLQTANTASPNDFTLFCDSYDRVLNQYKYAVQGVIVESYLGEFCSDSGKIVPCINSLCVLKLPNSAVIGTTLNIPVDNTLKSFLRAINKSSALCNSVRNGTTFLSCGEGVWYDPQLQSVMLLPAGMNPPPQATEFQNYATNKLSEITQYVMDILHNPANPGMNFEYFTRARLFNHLYVAQKGTKSVFGFLDTNMRPEQDPVPLDYLGIKYSGINLGIDPCIAFIKPYDSRAFCENQTSAGFVAVARHRPGLGESPLVSAWPALAGKIRP